MLVLALKKTDRRVAFFNGGAAGPAGLSQPSELRQRFVRWFFFDVSRSCPDLREAVEIE
jgi:hypothetical protein